MNKSVLFLGLCLSVLFASNMVFAQDSYRVEVGLGYLSTEDDSNTELTLMSIDATYYLSDVNTSGHPLEEAAFLEHAGYASVAIGEGNIDVPSSTDTDLSVIGASVDYIIPDSLILMGVVYTKTESKISSSFQATVDDVAFRFGKYLSDNLLVKATYGTGEVDINGSVADTDELGVDVKYVITKDDGSSCNLEASLTRYGFEYGATDETDTIISISGDHYINNRLSIGLGYNIYSSDDADSEGNNITVGIKNFSTKTVSAEVEFNKYSADNSGGDDEDGLNIRVAARF